MSWKITFTGHDAHDENDSAKSAHDFAIRDKAQGLFNDLLRLAGGTIDEAVVDTDTTGEVNFIPQEPAPVGTYKDAKKKDA